MVRQVPTKLPSETGAVPGLHQVLFQGCVPRYSSLREGLGFSCKGRGLLWNKGWVELELSPLSTPSLPLVPKATLGQWFSV